MTTSKKRDMSIYKSLILLLVALSIGTVHAQSDITISEPNPCKGDVVTLQPSYTLFSQGLSCGKWEVNQNDQYEIVSNDLSTNTLTVRMKTENAVRIYFDYKLNPTGGLDINCFDNWNKLRTSALIETRQSKDPIVSLDYPRSICEGADTEFRAIVSNVEDLGKVTYKWEVGNQTITNNSDRLTIPIWDNTVITVTAISGDRCSEGNEGKATVSVSPVLDFVPRVTILDGDALLCDNETVVLAAPTGGNNYSYQWFDSNGDINGATNRTFLVSSSGSYGVRMTLNGCANSSNTLTITKTNTSTPNINLSGNVTVCGIDNPTTLTSSVTGNRYRWTVGGEPYGQDSRTITPTISGEYKVSVLQGSCWGPYSQGTNITVIEEPVISTFFNTRGIEGDQLDIKVRTDGLEQNDVEHEWYTSMDRDVASRIPASSITELYDTPGQGFDHYFLSTYTITLSSAVTYYVWPVREVNNIKCYGEMKEINIIVDGKCNIVKAGDDIDLDICYGASPGTLDPGLPVLEHTTLTPTYQWLEQVGSTAPTTISGATDRTYSPPGGFTSSRSYIREVRINGPSCDDKASSRVDITVEKNFVPGTFSNTSYNVCNDEEVFLDLPPASGPGNFSGYRWETSVNGSSGWSAIPGQTGEDIQLTSGLISGTIKTRPFIRRFVTFTGTGCSPSSGPSNVVQVDVVEPPEPEFSIPDNFSCETFSISASHNDPPPGITHTWYADRGTSKERVLKIDNTVSVTGIFTTEINEIFLERTVITLEVSVANCGPRRFDRTIEPRRPAITYDEKNIVKALCFGGSPGELNPGIPDVGDLGSYRIDYVWYEVTDNGRLERSSQAFFNVGNLTSGTIFERQTTVRYGEGLSCKSVTFRDTYTITMGDTPLTAGGISSNNDLDICYGIPYNTFYINADAPQGGNGNYRYRWYISDNASSGFEVVEGAKGEQALLVIRTDDDQLAGSGTFYVKREVYTLGECTDQDISAAVAITVTDVPGPSPGSPSGALGTTMTFDAVSQGLLPGNSDHSHEWRLPDGTVLTGTVDQNSSVLRTTVDYLVDDLNTVLQVRAINGGCASTWVDVPVTNTCDPVVSPGNDIDMVICEGEQVDTLDPGVATVSCPGLTIDYRWYDTNNVDDILSTDQVLTVNSALTGQTLFIREAYVDGINGTKESVYARITAEAPIGPGIIYQFDMTICEGRELTLVASPPSNITVTPTYQWRHGASASGPFTDILGADDETYTLPTSGQDLYDFPYYVRAVTGRTCTVETDPVHITVNPAFSQTASLDPTGPITICDGTTTTLTAAPTGTGYTYAWYRDGDPFPVADNTVNTLDVSEAGDYTVTVSNGVCSTDPSTAVGVIIGTPEDIEICTEGPNNIFCNGSVRLFVPQITGATYNWTVPAGSASSSSTYELIADTSGIYTLDIVNGVCSFTTSIEVLDITIDPLDQNYVRSFTAQTEDMQEGVALAAGLPEEEVMVSTQYIDGLGRPIQKVDRRASPGAKDMVSFQVYDALGRQPVQYLPYAEDVGNGNFIPCPIPEQAAFYNNTAGNNADGIANDGHPFSVTTFENSLLDRVDAVSAPGASWTGADRKVLRSQLSNTIADRIWQFSIGDNDAYPSVSSDYYPAGELMVARSVDEMGSEALEFTDKKGRVLLKRVKLTEDNTDAITGAQWLDTYYIYDIYDNLRYVLPPEAMERLGGIFIGDAAKKTMDLFAFRYEYDIRNRLIVKKVPGTGNADGSGGEVHMVYDDLDRLVLSQDAEQRRGDVWSFTKYDALNRPVMTGLWRSDVDRATAQQDVDTYTGTRLYVRKRDNGGNGSDGNALTGRRIVLNRDNGQTELRAFDGIIFSGNYSYRSDPGDIIGMSAEIDDVATDPAYEGTWSCGYFDATFPEISQCRVWTCSYYDDYSFASDIKFEEIYDDRLLLEGEEKYISVPLERPTGLLTGSMTRVLGTENFLPTVTFYDHKDRVIQTLSGNHTGGMDIQTTRYDFLGRVLRTHLEHTNAEVDNTVKVTDAFAYDHMGRVLQVDQSITGGSEGMSVEEGNFETLCVNEYNELGELKSKLQAQGNDQIEQKMDYAYNIRGWLKWVNKDVYGSQTFNDLFSMELFYDDASHPDAAVNAQGYAPQYNGNIAAMSWQTDGDAQASTYAYGYDLLNRLKKADYTGDIGNYDVSGITYDLNGNIASLNRMGATGVNPSAPGGFDFGQMDDLLYDYDGTGNRLRKVVDIGEQYLEEAGDFNDGNTSGDDYFYDLNGNLLKDLNKGIRNDMVYNELNLPERIEVVGKGRIEYLYDAAGIKLAKYIFEGDTRVKKFDYIEGFVYKDNDLEFLHTKEGRALPPDALEDIPHPAEAVKGFVYEYHQKDHLGNLRVAFRDRLYSYMATMEFGNAQDESKFFENLDATRSSTRGYGTSTESALVNPGNSVGQAIGPYIRLDVNPGDRISTQVRVSYDVTGTGTDMFNAGSILQSFTGGEAGGVNNVSFTVQSQMDNPGNDPNAYLALQLFDKDGNAIQGASQITWVTNMEGGWGTLAPSGGVYEVQQEGHIIVYVANESDVDVWFDDLEVSVVNDPIVQVNHYYPFGLNLTGLEKQGTPDHKYTYNGKEKQEEFGLNWYDYEARTMDMQLGRFSQIDPLSEKYFDTSPYTYVGNNPILRIDPDGKEWTITRTGNEEDGYHYNITFTGKVINESGNEHDMGSVRDRIQSALEASYNGKDGNVSWNITVDLKEVESMDEVEDTDHVFHIVSNNDKSVNFRGLKRDGNTEYGTLDMFINEDVIANRPNTTDSDYPSFGTGLSKEGKSTLERTSAHEAGHTAWLLHPRDHIKEEKRSGKFISREAFGRNGFKNLMFQSRRRKNASMGLIREQLEVFYNQRKNININRRKK